jgi:hypothetical protein
MGYKHKRKEPEFWVAAAIGMMVLLFGFWLGKRTDLA